MKHPASEFTTRNYISGRWVTTREYSRLTGISEGVLGNWRTRDMREGAIRPGYPVWRRFGTDSIRYWLPDDLVMGAPGNLRPPAVEVADANCR